MYFRWILLFPVGLKVSVEFVVIQLTLVIHPATTRIYSYIMDSIVIIVWPTHRNDINHFLVSDTCLQDCIHI